VKKFRVPVCFTVEVEDNDDLRALVADIAESIADGYEDIKSIDYDLREVTWLDNPSQPKQAKLPVIDCCTCGVTPCNHEIMAACQYGMYPYQRWIKKQGDSPKEEKE
jgi:hypothetical protein